MLIPGYAHKPLGRFPHVARVGLLAAATLLTRVVVAEVSFFQGQAPNKAIHDFDFIRGDANLDGQIDISDPIHVLFGLFAAGGELWCQDSADANDDGAVEITDPIFTLRYLFASAAAPSLPFPERGVDPSPDYLDCRPNQAPDRWILSVRPVLATMCTTGCNEWMTFSDEPTPEGHLAAFSRWAQAAGVSIVRIWTQATPPDVLFEPFTIIVQTNSAIPPEPLFDVGCGVLLAPPGIFQIYVQFDEEMEQLRLDPAIELIWEYFGRSAILRAEMSALAPHIATSTCPTFIFPRMHMTWAVVTRCLVGWIWDTANPPPSLEEGFVQTIEARTPGDVTGVFGIVNPRPGYDPFSGPGRCGDLAFYMPVLVNDELYPFIEAAHEQHRIWWKWDPVCSQ